MPEQDDPCDEMMPPPRDEKKNGCTIPSIVVCSNGL